MKREKPGALLYFNEWNPIINGYPTEEIGKITKCALLYAQGKDITESLSSLCPELQGVWTFICNSLIRSDVSYTETTVKRAWGGYKKNHGLPDSAKIGDSSFVKWYVQSKYYDENLFHKEEWYDYVLEAYAEHTNNNSSSNSNSNLSETISKKETIDKTVSVKEEGYREEEKKELFPSHPNPADIKNKTPKSLQEEISRLAKQKQIINK